MATYRKNLSKASPSQSRFVPLRDAVLVLAVIVIPLHIWGVLHVLEELPAWLLRLSVWELAGAVAYTQAFTLFESLLVLLPLLALGTLLPRRFYANQFVAQSSVLVIVLSLWAVAAHEYYGWIRSWGARQFLPWLLVIAISILAPYLLLRRFPRLERIILSIVRRVAILSAIYIAIDLLSVLVVLVRNLGGG